MLALLILAGVLTHGVSFSSSGIEVDDEVRTLIGQGKEIKDSKPRKEDIVQE